MKDLKIGIIVADADEYKPFEKKIESLEYGEFSKYSFLGRKGHKFTIKGENRNAQVTSILCGIGKVNATAIATHFADNQIDYILSYGLSGGISGIKRGEICICDSFLEHDFDLTVIGYKPCEKPLQEYIYNADSGLIDIFKNVIENVKIGRAVSGDSFICDDEKRLKFKNQFNAMSCDMETAAIAYVASSSNIPFTAIRRISDDAGNDATESYTEMNNEDETILSDYLIKGIKEILKK